MSKAIYPVEFDVPHSNGLKFLEYFQPHNVFHPGWDLNKGRGDADIGNPIKCPFDGVVQYVSPPPSILNRQNKGLGWCVVIYHPAYGVWSRYGHMLEEPSCSVGDKLKTSQVFGKVGKSGTTSAHLHWDLWNSKFEEFINGDYLYYPSGKSRSWVIEHFINGLEFVEMLNQPPKWEDLEKEWAGKYIQNLELLTSPYIYSFIALVHRAHEELSARISGLEEEIQKLKTK